MAAGTVTVTQLVNNGIRLFKFEWVSGSAPDTVGEAHATTTFPIYGQALALVTTPGTGAATPTDDYDITVKDSATGLDVLWGAGANRDSVNSEQVAPTSPSVAYGLLTFTVTAAGSAKAGTAWVYVRG